MYKRQLLTQLYNQALVTGTLGLAPPKTHHSMRTKKAAQGRKPKLKKPLELSAPVFIEDEKGRLQLSENTSLVAKALGLAEKLA